MRISTGMEVDSVASRGLLEGMKNHVIHFDESFNMVVGCEEGPRLLWKPSHRRISADEQFSDCNLMSS